MSCFVISNLVVTAGMLTPGLTVRFYYVCDRYMTPLADIWLDDRHTTVANHKPVPERRHQQRQCE